MSQGVSAETESPIAWFSRSKTRAPRISIDLVERKRLLLELDAALDKPVSCIIAPAGFGKSTLLYQWRESLLNRDIACAWINLDENDNEIRQFFAYLVFAFEDAGVSLGYLKQAAENGFVDMSSSAITTSLLSAIIDIPDHMVLVLDDYHRAASDEIDGFVRILSDQCGDRVHIAIGSREPVQINLPNLLVAGRAIEIPSIQLRFSDREVWEVMGDILDRGTILELQELIEGWPVAVQMTRLFSQTVERNDVSQKGISSSHGHLADYLVTNVLKNQSEDLQQFLLETAILKRFSAEFANSVCDHQNSEKFIDRLQSLQALIVPLDDDSEWFRYHHLFSECLSDLLNRQDPDRFIELHRRAATWCSENRLISEAVDYANAIKDYDLSRRIINDNCEWMRAMQFGGVGYLNGLLANIPEKEISKDPRMLFSKANACMIVGDFKNSLFYNNAAEALIEEQGVTPETFRDRFGVGTGIEIRVENGVDRNGGWLKERLDIVDALAENDPALRVVSGLMRTAFTVQKTGYGDFDLAREYAHQAESNLALANNPVTVSYCQVSIGLIDLWTNSMEQAKNRFQAAIDLAISFSGDQSNMKFVGETLLRSVDYWQNDLSAEPPHELENALLHALDTDGWYDIYSIGFDAVVHDALCRNDLEKADALVKKLDQSTDRFAIERLSQFAQLLSLKCAIGRGDLIRAETIYDQVQDWLDADEIETENFGWFHRTIAAYVCACFLKAVDRSEDALAFVDLGLKEVSQLNVALLCVRGNILKASILKKMGKEVEAIPLLQNAIEDAARVNCPKPFAGDVSENLLAEAVSKILGKTQTHMEKDFAARLAIAGTEKMFSDREEQVLLGISQGKSNKEIARMLDLTDNTIKFHLRNIYRKLGVKKRVPAVEKARELGVLS